VKGVLDHFGIDVDFSIIAAHLQRTSRWFKVSAVPTSPTNIFVSFNCVFRCPYTTGLRRPLSRNGSGTR